jgi:hypothetical protein
MTAFLLLFFFVFLAIVLFGIMGAANLGSPKIEYLDVLDPGVNLNDVVAKGNTNDLNSIIAAMEEKAESPFFELHARQKIGVLSGSVADLAKRVHVLEFQRMVFVLMLSGLALVLGLAAAFIALTTEISALFGP